MVGHILAKEDLTIKFGALDIFFWQMPEVDEKLTTHNQENWRIRIRKEISSAHEWDTNWGFLRVDDQFRNEPDIGGNRDTPVKSELDILMQSSSALRV